MTTYSEICKKCGKVFYLDDYITGDYKADAEAYCQDLKEHSEEHKK